MRPDEEPRSSWICRNEFERARFTDLNGRLLRANTSMLLALVVVIAAAMVFVPHPDRLGLVPAACGMALFAAIQRSAPRFARPELWVFAALLGAEAMIVLAIAAYDGALTPAMALICWPVAGVAGRFPDRASRLGTLYAAALAGTAVAGERSRGADQRPAGPGPPAGGDRLDPHSGDGAAQIGHRAPGRSHSRSADRDAQPHRALHAGRRRSSTNRSWPARRSPSSWRTSTASSSSTTPTAMRLGTRFSKRSPTGSGSSCAPMTSHTGSAARSSWSCCWEAPRQRGPWWPSSSARRSPLEPIAGLDITVSVGVAASAPGTSFVWKDVFARADAALYQAKADGRDRVATQEPVRRNVGLSLVSAD